MINYKLIASIIVAQIGLIFISFKAPDIPLKKESKTTVENNSENEKLIIAKNFVREEGDYILNYHYPFLNQSGTQKNSEFNRYFKETFLNDKKPIKNSFNDKALFCDTSQEGLEHKKSFLDYKVYLENPQLVSVLVFKGDYHDNSIHSSYTFKALNFDLETNRFLDYDAVFKKGTESKIISIINKKMSDKFRQFDCWELINDEFELSKDNFTLSKDSIKFYFDDCVICPSYAGEYSVEIETEELMKFFNDNKIINKALKS